MSGMQRFCDTEENSSVNRLTDQCYVILPFGVKSMGIIQTLPPANTQTLSRFPQWGEGSFCVSIVIFLISRKGRQVGCGSLMSSRSVCAPNLEEKWFRRIRGCLVIVLLGGPTIYQGDSAGTHVPQVPARTEGQVEIAVERNQMVYQRRSYELRYPAADACITPLSPHACA